ncbi:uncharacterized protein BDW47DRAFT_129545 [Aspergillus candidus]|uniref:Uncharacterized protein n=1 Tax=Aspergillus candidus TaxID=41067 RepID=A0A2I2EZP2_ASPCN|nr:hypothetical protein BDW47DRAFT_129545 [Aspergillus candidus]PLB33855.1 hypothetical protein BDW47DRAFT_129545 [Aspergillus candidus]
MSNYYYIYVGPFEADSIPTIKDYLVAARAKIRTTSQHVILRRYNEALTKDHLLLVIYSNHLINTDEGRHDVLQDAVAAVTAHIKHMQEQEQLCLYLLPSFETTPFEPVSGKWVPDDGPRVTSQSRHSGC